MPQKENPGQIANINSMGVIPPAAKREDLVLNPTPMMAPQASSKKSNEPVISPGLLKFITYFFLDFQFNLFLYTGINDEEATSLSKLPESVTKSKLVYRFKIPFKKNKNSSTELNHLHTVNRAKMKENIRSS